MLSERVCLARAKKRLRNKEKIYSYRIKRMAMFERKRLREVLRARKLREEQRALNGKAKRQRDMIARRIARIKANGGGHTQEEWNELKARYDGRCAFCGGDEKVQRDHIIPISKGGSDSIDNIQPLCWPCNFRKGSRIIGKDALLSEMGHAA